MSVILGVAIVLFVLWDGFETMVSPRRVTRRVRLTRLFYRFTWIFWSRFVSTIFSAGRSENYLSVYGPLSLLLLMTIWAGALIFGFGLLHWACNSASTFSDAVSGFATNLYLSGTTFFTLGIGDITPRTPSGKILTVVEAGLGFGFLALIISHLPVLNQSFAARETNISMLDARAGSPPAVSEMLARLGRSTGKENLDELLSHWERWAAELLESHLSYPVLAYFRSQHDNQSWISTLTAILDTCAVLITGMEKDSISQAHMTFAMARHAVVDMATVFNLPPEKPKVERLSPDDLETLVEIMIHNGLMDRKSGGNEKLSELRDMYEPYVNSLADYFCLSLPHWVRRPQVLDNWQTSAWRRIDPSTRPKHRHF